MDGDGSFVPGSMPAFERASRTSRFDEGAGGSDAEEEDDVGQAYFSKRAIPAGLEMEIALMREERERDKQLKDQNASIVDRREWENREIGVGYQHKTVVRQAQAVHEKVKIKDMTKGKGPKKSAEEKEAAKVLKRAKEAELAGGPLLPPTAESLERLQALLRLELRKRKRQRGESLLSHTSAPAAGVTPGTAEEEEEEEEGGAGAAARSPAGEGGSSPSSGASSSSSNSGSEGEEG